MSVRICRDHTYALGNQHGKDDMKEPEMTRTEAERVTQIVAETRGPAHVCTGGSVKTVFFPNDTSFLLLQSEYICKTMIFIKSYLSSWELVASILRMLLSASGQPDRL